MFVRLQKGQENRVVKAASYEELKLKAGESFKVIDATLTFHEPNGEKLIVDSDDCFEYIEIRTQEEKQSDSTFKPLVVLDSDSLQIQTQITRGSDREMVFSPVAVARDTEILTNIVLDRPTEVFPNAEVNQEGQQDNVEEEKVTEAEKLAEEEIKAPEEPLTVPVEEPELKTQEEEKAPELKTDEEEKHPELNIEEEKAPELNTEEEEKDPELNEEEEKTPELNTEEEEKAPELNTEEEEKTPESDEAPKPATPIADPEEAKIAAIGQSSRKILMDDVAADAELPLVAKKVVEASPDSQDKPVEETKGDDKPAPEEESKSSGSKLEKEHAEMKQMLLKLAPLVSSQAMDIRAYRRQIDTLMKQKHDISNQLQLANAESVPCFRCDGRQTENGQRTACKRCLGTGRVNTQHEKLLLQMIQSSVQNQVLAVSDPKNEGPKAIHEGVTCAVCKSSPLEGTRYACLTCEQMSICGQCEKTTQHAKLHPMAVINTPELTPVDLIDYQVQLAERQKAIRAQELISESLSQPAGKQSSVYKAVLESATLKKNQVFKAAAVVENTWKFKNSGTVKIPQGTKLVVVKGDIEMRVLGLCTESDAKPGEFFEVRLVSTAPQTSRHFNAEFQLVDEQGCYFGDKAILDIIVEEDNSESIALFSSMRNFDDIEEQKTGKNLDPRNERTSMMIQHPPKKPTPVQATMKPGTQSLGQIDEEEKGQVIQDSFQFSDKPDPSASISAMQPQNQPQQPMAQIQAPISAMQQPQGMPQPLAQMQTPVSTMQQPPQAFPLDQPQGQPQQMMQPQAAPYQMMTQPQPIVQQQSMVPPTYQPNPIVPPTCQPNQIVPPTCQPNPIMQPQAQHNPMLAAATVPDDFFDAAALRYPSITLSGPGTQAAALTGHSDLNDQPVIPSQGDEEVKGGQQNASGTQTYQEKLDRKFPAKFNAVDKHNRQSREALFTLRDFGYEDFDKNLSVIIDFKQRNQLEDMVAISQAIERVYNPGPAVQAPPSTSAAQAQQQPLPATTQRPTEPASAGGVAVRYAVDVKQQQIIMDYKKKAGKEKEKYSKVLLQLLEMGFTDFKKNLKIVKKAKTQDIMVLIEKINKA